MSNSDTLSCSGKLVIISIDRHCTVTNSLTENSKSMNHMLFLKCYSHLRTLHARTSLGHKHYSLQSTAAEMWFLAVEWSPQFPGWPSIPGGGFMIPWPLMDGLPARPDSKPGNVQNGLGAGSGSLRTYIRGTSVNIRRKNTKHVILLGNCFTHIEPCT